LQARCDVANNNNTDIFVSIHCNAAATPDAGGTEVWKARQSSDATGVLADRDYAQMSTQLPLDGRGVQEANFWVLVHTTMPAVLNEVAFVSNPREEALLADPDFQAKAAHALADGLTSYFNPASVPAFPQMAFNHASN